MQSEPIMKRPCNTRSDLPLYNSHLAPGQLCRVLCPCGVEHVALCQSASKSLLCLTCGDKALLEARESSPVPRVARESFSSPPTTDEEAYLLAWLHVCPQDIKDGSHVIEVGPKEEHALLSAISRALLGQEVVSTEVRIPHIDSLCPFSSINVPSLRLAFLRGLLDACGHSSQPSDPNPRLSVSLPSLSLCLSLQEASPSPCTLSSSPLSLHSLTWTSANALSLLQSLFPSPLPRLSSSRHPLLLRRWSLLPIPVAPSLRFWRDKKKDDPSSFVAPLPSRALPSDSGLDVVLTELHSSPTPRLLLYRTGLRVAPDPGVYVELVARSSLSKTGHMLANSVGIIDNQYRGEILVALYKFDPVAPPLQLPLRACQLIPRLLVDVNTIDVIQLSETKRGEGGFGSTGK